MTFLRALMQGLGFGTGVEVVREIAKGLNEAEAPPETEAQRAARIERELREAEKARLAAEREALAARKAQAEKKARDAREVDRELAELKAKLGK